MVWLWARHGMDSDEQYAHRRRHAQSIVETNDIHIMNPSKITMRDAKTLVDASTSTTVENVTL